MSNTIRPKQITPDLTPRTRYGCAIRTCDWAYERADLTPPPFGGLGGVDETLHLMAQQAAEVEAVIREHFETHGVEEWTTEVTLLRQQLAAAEETAAPKPWEPMCTLCLKEAKEAQLRGITPPEINGVAVFANGVGICEIRHQITVEPPKLLLAQPGQVPAFGG